MTREERLQQNLAALRDGDRITINGGLIRNRLQVDLCADCGMGLVDPIEYHPFLACQVYKRTHDSREVWRAIRREANQLAADVREQQERNAALRDYATQFERREAAEAALAEALRVTAAAAEVDTARITALEGELATTRQALTTLRTWMESNTTDGACDFCGEWDDGGKPGGCVCGLVRALADTGGDTAQCCCGEINTRHCPVHGAGGDTA